ncbi:retrovirus-related pol polyprotein from transposon TNT 1-94 [Tanacetum coccineum]
MSNTNMQTQTSNALYNAIMEAGGKDRPPILASAPVAEGSSETTTEWYMENYKNVSQDIQDQLNAEAEAKAIKRLKQGESINVQDLETNLYWEFGKFTSWDGESFESYYSMVSINDQHQNEVQREIRADKRLSTSQQATRNRGKAIVNSSAPIYDQEPAMKIYKPTNNKLPTSSNTSRANQDNSPRINRGTRYENQRAVNVAGARENVEEAGVQLNAEQADWKDDTDDESDDQDQEARYMYMPQYKRVILTTSVSRPQLKSNRMGDSVMPNNSQGKKQEVEDHRRNFKFSNNKMSVTACNDSLNAKTSNVNFVCVTCGKCVLNDNHDLCVLHYINGVNSRTRQPIAVPISTREPKLNVNQSVATSHKKIVATDSTVKKPRNIIRKIYEQVSKTCSWWYPKFTPPGYKWKPKSPTGNVNPNVSMPLGNASRTANILEPMTPRCSTISNTPLSSSSFAARRYNPIHRTVKFRNDQIAPILGYGDLVQGTITIKRVYYVEGLNHNLFSVGQFCDADLEVAFRKSTCYICDLKGNDLLIGSRGTDLYSITLQDTTTPNPICLMAKATSSQAWLWHRRLSHLNFDTINLLSKNNIVTGLPKLKFVKDHLCSSCELGKAKRKSFHTKTTPSSKRRLQLLHMDLCGPMRVESINGKKYVLVIVDDYSRYTWTHFLRSKDETPAVLIDFLTLVQRGLHAQVRTVRIDKGTKFLNKTLHAYFAKEGIRHETSTARTLEQNGVVKRRNRTLIEVARTMLSAAKVPLFFWAEAIASTCFTQNCSLVIPRHEKTPYHIINGQKPSVKFFHIFSSLCYIVRDGENLDKMKEKGDACIFVGYSTQSRAYSVFNKRTRIIVETIHVNSDELPQMASDHVSSDPAPQSETVTTSNELDLLFSPMFDELLNGTTLVVSKSFAVTNADAPNQRQQQHTTPSTSTTVAADTPLLNIQTTPETTSQAPTQAPIITPTENINQPEINKENAQVEEDEFVNVFSKPI